jgi:uncharacterized protein (DUF2236 family)
LTSRPGSRGKPELTGQLDGGGSQGVVLGIDTAVLEAALERLPLWGTTRTWLERMALRLNEPPDGSPRFDFCKPAGDPGIFGPEAVIWRVNSNPVSFFTGGVAAVLFELAEPRVRSGVWDHTDFRTDPIGRLRRTGVAAMVTTYGSKADLETVTKRVRKMHDGVRGTTPEGEAYHANDPELLRWVFTTATWGFLRGHLRYASPGSLLRPEQDRYYAEAARVAPYYGIADVPTSVAEVEAYFEEMRPQLCRHEIIEEFLGLISNAPALSPAALPLQSLLVGAGIDLLPRWAREQLDLDKSPQLRSARALVARAAAALAGRIIRSGPAQQACRRMGLPADYLAH